MKVSEIVKIQNPTDPRFIDRTGLVSHHLTVIAYAGKIKGISNWFCICDCNALEVDKNVIVVPIGSLTSGDKKSCGCIPKSYPGNTKHNKRYTKEYKAWQHAKSRCYNPKNEKYSIYGGRGIKMSEEWKNSPTKFIEDMGLKPSEKHSLDRIDVNGDYCKENCRWATSKEQANNKKYNRYIEYNNQKRTLSEWAEITGLSVGCIAARIKRGWSAEKILLCPKIVNQYSIVKENEINVV